MNLLVWNCRELGNPQTERGLVEILQAKDHSVMFIVKTWADEARLDQTLRTINFDKKMGGTENNKRRWTGFVLEKFSEIKGGRFT